MLILNSSFIKRVFIALQGLVPLHTTARLFLSSKYGDDCANAGGLKFKPRARNATFFYLCFAVHWKLPYIAN